MVENPIPLLSVNNLDTYLRKMINKYQANDGLPSIIEGLERYMVYLREIKEIDKYEIELIKNESSKGDFLKLNEILNYNFSKTQIFILTEIEKESRDNIYPLCSFIRSLGKYQLLQIEKEEVFDLSRFEFKNLLDLLDKLEDSRLKLFPKNLKNLNELNPNNDYILNEKYASKWRGDKENVAIEEQLEVLKSYTGLNVEDLKLLNNYYKKILDYIFPLYLLKIKKEKLLVFKKETLNIFEESQLDLNIEPSDTNVDTGPIETTKDSVNSAAKTDQPTLKKTYNKKPIKPIDYNFPEIEFEGKEKFKKEKVLNRDQTIFLFNELCSYDVIYNVAINRTCFSDFINYIAGYSAKSSIGKILSLKPSDEDLKKIDQILNEIINSNKYLDLDAKNLVNIPNVIQTGNAKRNFGFNKFSPFVRKNNDKKTVLSQNQMILLLKKLYYHKVIYPLDSDYESFALLIEFLTGYSAEKIKDTISTYEPTSEDISTLNKIFAKIIKQKKAVYQK